MRRIRKFIFTMMALTAAAFTLQSCLNDDDDEDIIIAPSTNVGVVTLKPGTEDNSNWWIQLTDSTVVTCSNIKEFPLKEKKEQRAYIYFNYDSDPSSLTADIKSITVIHIDTILTKQLAPALESEEANDKAYGNDPVEIVKSDLETLAEDGYMNIRFRATWLPGSKHRVNLVRVADEEGLATFYFHHDSNGQTSGNLGDGIVAFYLDLEKNLDRTPREIKIKWKSFTGEKSAKFKYIPRND